jgi:replicative DNA helicase
LLGGFQRSDLIILAARPSVGKTSLALSIAYNAAKKHEKRVALFSLEMSSEQVVQRLISAETGIDSQRLRRGEIAEDEWGRFAKATSDLADSLIFIDDTPSISALELRTKARRLHAEVGIDLITVDYLQLMRGDTRSENRVQEISSISRALKALARELNVPVLALSQLSRGVESRTDKRPILSDLRESGALEQDADVVIFIYRDEMYNENTERKNIADIIIAKHRNGPTGSVALYFKRDLAQFREAELRRTEIDLLQ